MSILLVFQPQWLALGASPVLLTPLTPRLQRPKDESVCNGYSFYIKVFLEVCRRNTSAPVRLKSTTFLCRSSKSVCAAWSGNLSSLANNRRNRASQNIQRKMKIEPESIEKSTPQTVSRLVHPWRLTTAGSEQDGLRLLDPPLGQGADDGASTCDRGVPALIQGGFSIHCATSAS
ncbi:hypothetical protein PoB_006521700 [Plakobranchus ocellatus]|uniref:Uncharacterized protein n=1 Tax=Plakobranchus ocellatus TaxID=259542 RepID=A0AAV4D3F1_9GAST|nr:hypothetical protein PoB_006521700 [Plakobranchus ocellatus]